MIFILVWALAFSAFARSDFFGIPILGEPRDDVNAIMHNLGKGEYEKARQHLKHLATTAPKLAKRIKLSDFAIPCADCAVELDPECQECNGKLKRFDPHALLYLHYKFDGAVENKTPVEQAWADAKKAFDARKKQVPLREVFQGRIIKIGQDAFLVQSVDGEIFYLMGCVTDGASVGHPFVGYCWPMPNHPHTYKEKDGKSKTVKSYTLNLWWDY
jgi:hypothetical protein